MPRVPGFMLTEDGALLKKNRSCYATCGLHRAESRFFGFKDCGFSTLAVNVTVHYWIPARTEIVNQLVARTAVVQRQNSLAES